MITRPSQLSKIPSEFALREIYWGYGWGKTPYQKSDLEVNAYAPAPPPKFYVVSCTNKTGDLEAIFEIPYFQSTPKPKWQICYSYGPTNLEKKV